MKNKKEMLKKVLAFLAIIVALCSTIWVINQSISIADVGSFETYDSGSSWDDDDDDGGSILWLIWLIFDPDVPIIVKIIVLAIFIGIGIGVKKGKGNQRSGNMQGQYTQVRNNSVYNDAPDNSVQIAEQIQASDPNFNAEQFKSYVKDVFVKLQNAWTERDWEKIRTFETNELFEQHKAQLDGYIANNQINVMERICVNWVRLLSYEQSGDKEILTVSLNSRMGDYIIDATTKQVLRGNKKAEYTNTYVMQFVRTKGQQTPVGGQKVNTTNCPNCGAPTKIMTSGRCEYCGSVITTTNHGWVLNSLERK